jgi:hypothetical protein
MARDSILFPFLDKGDWAQRIAYTSYIERQNAGHPGGGAS